MRIRQAQLLAVRQSLTQAFETELLGDISTYFPERHTFIGDAHTRATIRLGIESAAEHGLHIKRAIAMVVTLMFVVGSYFGENPLYPWARKILVDDRGVGEATRAHRFYNRLRRYLSMVRDENKKYIEPIVLFPEEPLLTSSQALLTSSQALLTSSQALLTSSQALDSATLEEALLERLKAIAPAHVSTAGDESTRALIRLGVERAAHYRITRAEGLSMFVGLTFLLGLGFDQDPQFPWAAEALSPRADDSIESAVLRLRDAALTFRRHTLASGGYYG